MDRVIDFGKAHKGEWLSECPPEYLRWLTSHKMVLAERNRWAAIAAKELLEGPKETKIEMTLRPYGCHSEELAVGRIDEDGDFTIERGIWNVTKDKRLNVTREYEGKGAMTDVHFVVIVPGDYPLAIAKRRKVGHGSTKCSWETEVLYAPAA